MHCCRKLTLHRRRARADETTPRIRGARLVGLTDGTVRMQARDGPETRLQLETKDTSFVTRNEKPAKSSELRLRRTRKPTQKRAAKPPTVTGYHWRQHGAGWDLRKDVYVTSNGVRKRKQPYLAHLSREAFRELKRQHKGAALERAIQRWIAEHDR